MRTSQDHSICCVASGKVSLRVSPKVSPMPGERVAGSFSFSTEFMLFIPCKVASIVPRARSPHPSLCLRWTDSLDQLSPICGLSSIRDVKKHSLDNRNTKGSDIKDRYEVNLSHIHPHKKNTLIQPLQLQVENTSLETPIKNCAPRHKV